MKNKLLIGLAVLAVVVIAIILLMGKSKSAGQNTQTENTVNAPTTSTPNTSIGNSTQANDLIGTWVSSVQGKGMQGSGNLTISGVAVQINFTGDVDLVIQKVENNIATGTLAFTNFCSSKVTSVPGKPDVIGQAQCLSGNKVPAYLQIDGNKITYTGETILGASVTLNGTYTSDSISGTFTRTSSYGNINGTFNLVRAKN
jgi:hypothetical protein